MADASADALRVAHSFSSASARSLVFALVAVLYGGARVKAESDGWGRSEAPGGFNLF